MGFPQVRGVLSIIDSNWKRMTVPTTPAWSGLLGGPVRYGNIYGGEVYVICWDNSVDGC